MFVSCIVTASGRKLDPAYLSDWKDSRDSMYGRHRLLLLFGKEAPTAADWKFWWKNINDSPSHA